MGTAAPDPFCAPCGDCQGSGRIIENGFRRFCITCDGTGSKEGSRIAAPRRAMTPAEHRDLAACRKAIAALAHASAMRGLTGR